MTQETETEYVVNDPFTGRGVLGPYKDREYAEKCKQRYRDKWPGLLEVQERPA